ncbi:MAG: hypothetical protein Q9191_003715 [Dirinaria sp. TL-2023a]
MRDLNSHLYGNPHSQSPSSMLSTGRMEKARTDMLGFFKANPEHFDLIFVANATAAIKLVADGMRGSDRSGEASGFWYGYHAAAHTSLVGVREVASAANILNCDDDVEKWLAGKLTHNQAMCKIGLFAYPAQSNMNGRRLPLDWPGRLRRSSYSEHQNIYSLLDAAAYVTTAQLDLSNHLEAPDFVALSLHKIFGFPDLGVLIVRKDAGHVLSQRSYFGGGTVDMVINGVGGDSWHARKTGHLHEALEDGTPAFHSILALKPALEVHRTLYRDMSSISEHSSWLSKALYESMSSLSHYNGVALCRIYKDPSSQYGDPKSQGPTIAFNIQTSTQRWVQKSHVEQLAIVNGIQLRTGGVCNPGGIAWALNLTSQEMRANFAEGLRCGNGVDEMNGKPTGVIRVSLGAMSNTHDIQVLLSFLRLFLEEDAPPDVDEKAPNRAPNTPLSSLTKLPRFETTEVEKTVTYEERRMELDGLQPYSSQYACPVAACRAVHVGEEELGEHFRVHKQSTSKGNSRRQSVRSLGRIGTTLMGPRGFWKLCCNHLS